jgi:hypothetical protein
VIVERFAQNVVNSGMFRLYTASGFFATLIFFTLNAHLFTASEIIAGVICVTICLKGVTNIMFTLIVNFFKLDHKEAEIEFEYHKKKIESLVNDLAVKIATEDKDKK